MTLDGITRFINAINPLPRLLALLPANVAREVSLILTTAGGVLIVANETLLPAGSTAHSVIDAVLAVLVALGIRGNVTPVSDRRIRAKPTRR
jgi:hypothetical protein